MVSKILSRIDKKTIFAHYEPDSGYDAFYNELHGALNFLDSKDEQDILCSYKYGYWLFLRWGGRICKGNYKVFEMKFKARFASTFYELRQSELIYKNIYKDLKLEVGKLVDLKDTEWSRVTRDESGDEKSSGDEAWNRDHSSNKLFSETEKSGSRQISKERPFESLDLLGQHFGNMVQAEYMGRSDWLGGENLEIGGYIETERYPAGHEKHGEIVYDKDGNPSKIMNPNWVKQHTNEKVYDNSYKKLSDRQDHRKYGTDRIDKTFERQEQPLINGQIARIIMGYKSFQTYPTDLIESFGDLFSEFYIGGGDYVFSPVTWDYEYKTRVQIEKSEGLKVKEEEEEELREDEVDPDKELSLDEWKELWADKKKPCMPDWYLECIYRYKRRIDKKNDKEDTDNERMALCDIILDSFYRSPYVPPVEVYEVLMGSPEVFNLDETSGLPVADGTANSKHFGPWTHYRVTPENQTEAAKYKKKTVALGEILECEVEGFAEFKASLWEELRVAHRRRANKVPNFQTFPYLIGPPGTGKSEISRRLAEANKAPLALINCAGVDDPGYFEGKRPTLQNANYGKVMGAFIDSSIMAEVTLDDLRLEIEEIKTFLEAGVKTNRPIENITDWEKDRIKGLDKEIKEWEAENAERAAETPAKPPKLTKNKSYRSRAPIILLDEFEKIADEGAKNVVGKMTDRELNYTFIDNYFGYRIDLSKCQFLLTANYLDQVPQFIKDRGTPVNIELLTWEQRKKILRSRFKKELKVYKLDHLQGRITERFIEICAPETWGIRGGINNVAATIKFLEVLEVEKEDFDKGRPGFQNPWLDLNQLERPDAIEETPLEDYRKRETGTIKLIWNNVAGKRRELIIAKRIGIEARDIKDEDGNVRPAKEVVTGNDAESGKVFVPDWGGKEKKWFDSGGNEVAEGTANAVEKMWWYNYIGNRHIGYILRSIDKADTKAKPDKVYPNMGTHDIRGRLELRRDDDDNVYVINNVNAMLPIGAQNLMVQKIKLIAQLGTADRTVYEAFINDIVQRNYRLTIYNDTKTAWDPNKRQLTIYSKWNIIRV